MTTTRKEPISINHKEKIQSEAKKIVANERVKSSVPCFFKPLSPYHSYLDGYLADDETKKYGETYHRSEHSFYKDRNTKKYYKTDMVQGQRAHLGAYANNFERVGDSYQLRIAKTGLTLNLHERAVVGNAELYDAILKYKHSTCQTIANQVGDAAFIKAGFYNNYPCLMVYIKPQSIYKSAENVHKPTYADLKAWSNFLISMYVGYVNFHAKRNHLDIELVRRSSFGFLSPTIAETGTSFRLNVGVVPAPYVSILVDGLKALNQALANLHDPGKMKPALPEGCFYGSPEHRFYLTKHNIQQYQTPPLSDIFQLLWQQAESKGKTAVQNMMRTSFARDGLASEVYKALVENPHDLFGAMAKALMWAVSRMRMVRNTLSFDNRGAVAYPVMAQVPMRETVIDDPQFWDLIRQIMSVARVRYESEADVVAFLGEMDGMVARRVVVGMYKHLEALNEYILLSVIRREAKSTLCIVADGYGSDSEDEELIGETAVYTKKVVVSNGMRAILATLLAIGHKLGSYSLYVDSAYYEVAGGIKLLKQFADAAITVKKPAAMTTANAYVYDVNACVTDGSSAPSVFNQFVDRTEGKILVLDTTSATTEQMHGYVVRFSQTRASAMMFVSSGLKNEQLGADKNAYGTIRLFAKDKNVIKDYYDGIKRREPALDSPISHEYRREMKRLGGVPTARAIFKK